MRILLIPFSGGVGLGPLTRCLAVAEEGKKRKHEVAFLCKPFFKHITDGFGFKTYLAPDTVHLSRKFPKYRLSDIALEYGLINVDYLQKAIRRELEVIKIFSPDIIFTETQFSINFSSAASGVPWATAVSWTDHAGFRSPLYKTVSIYPKQLEQINRFASQYTLKPYDDLCDLAFTRAHVKIAPTSKELQPELLSIPDVHFVGSLLSNALEGQSNGIKLPVKKSPHSVYVYMSPGEISANQWIRIICDTFRDQPYNVFVMLAPLKKIPNPLPKLPNVYFLPLSPTRRFLLASDVVITHGGGNTIVNALLHGKPLLVFPHNYAERDYNGRAIERLGAGLNLSTDAFTPRIVRGLVEKLIQDKSFAKSASILGKSLRRLGGVKKTVDVIETYCEKT